MTACRRRRDAALPRTILVCALAIGLSAPLVAAPRFFIAHFQMHLSPQLRDADAAFVVDRGRIHRRPGPRDPSLACCSGDRHYITTARSDYVSLNWTYEITFTSPSDARDEILYIGLGEGVPDPSFFNEPRNSLNFRIHQGITGATQPGWDVDVAAHDVGFFHDTFFQSLGNLGGPGGGTWTARVRKIGTSISFEILGTPIAVTIPDVTVAAPFLNAVPSHIFFGNALAVYSFSDMRVLPERVH